MVASFMINKIAVLLPEGKLFDQLFAEAIEPALPGAVRLRAEFSSESQLGPICNAIEAAEWVVADLSGKNPNVMYLAGFAHGIGKKVVFLAQHLEDFPFDKAKHPVIGYGADRVYLRTELSHFAANGKLSAGGQAPEPESARARFLEVFGEILAKHGYEHRGEVQLENPTTFILLNQEMDLRLVQDLARKARELGLRLKLM